MTVRVEHADMLAAIPRLVAEGVLVDAVVTDPPYHLQAVKRWGNETAVAANPDLKGNGMHRFAKGFMGAAWDGGDIAYDPATWATIATIMRPGAFLVAFGGTRTHHRVWCAIEDAGFVIQDTIAWMFGTGFPKRRDMLKPAFEPIVLAYKPGGRRTMQVDECRIGTESTRRDTGTAALWGEAIGRIVGGSSYGRWPANVVHDGSDEVLAAFPPSKAGQPTDARGKGGFWGASNGMACGPQYGDSGTAARFFFSAKAGAQDRWGSRHPTVKPIDLIAWLVKLVVQPGSTFLDPFAGSGTAGVAAIKTGRNAILIEREAAYVADIRERLVHYDGNGRHSLASKARNSDHKPLGGLFA